MNPLNPYGPIFTFIALALYIFAFVNAETEGRVVLTVILALILGLPHVFHSSIIQWVCYIGKILFAIGCYLYVKVQKSSPW